MYWILLVALLLFIFYIAWPVFLALLVFILVVGLFNFFKIKKTVKQMNEDINATIYDDNIEEVKNSDVIDAEYTEKEIK
ncbi:MAG: hypothetical protein WBO70_03850 [Erysipelotrichaceae bacterium]